MGQIGSAPWSFKTDTGWRGMTTSSKSLPGHFDLLENCYVSGDGSEIRSMPGYVCIVDPVSDARVATDTSWTAAPFGYECIHTDARRPVTTAVGGYSYMTSAVSATDVQRIWCRPTTIHGVEQIHGRWIFFGESSDRMEPILNNARTAFTYIVSYDDNGGTQIDLTLNTAPSVTDTQFNGVTNADGLNRIYVEGLVADAGQPLTATIVAALNGKSHTVTNVAGAVVTINTPPGGTITSVAGQSAIIAKVSVKPTGASATDVSNDQESLTIWTATSKGSVSSTPIERVYPAHVANRQRDFGDALSNVREGSASIAGSEPNVSRRVQLPIPYRIVPHSAGNRLVFVAPGYGCVFQAPVVAPVDFSESSSSSGIQWIGNDVFDKPRSLGIPKCVQHEDPDKDPATSFHIIDGDTLVGYYGGTNVGYAFGGTDASASPRNGTYKFKFAYRDEITGETGLCSEPVVVKTTATAPFDFMGLQFRVYFPGYLLHETLALSINVYRTVKDGDTYYFDRTIPMRAFIVSVSPATESSKYGLYPSTVGDEYYHHALYAAVYQSDELLKKQDGYVPESVEQMPMGAKAGRTIRGWTFLGGSMGNSGPSQELQRGTLTLEYDNASGVNSTHYNYNELTTRWTDGLVPTFSSMEDGFGCGGRSIPSAYMGQRVISKTLFPYPRHSVQLNKLINTISGETDVRWADVRYSVLDTPLRSTETLANAAFRNQDAYLVLPRGKIQISEPDNPGVTPATNITTIANELDEDVEAIGDMGGQAVICTRSRTYMLGFGGSPVGVLPDVASDRFGCIAPNSMVEFDGGCAWISDRGPVAMVGGAVQWIGEPLERLFYGISSRYLRDRRGMMRHSWACHDAERGLIYFGVFANRAQGTDHEVEVSYRASSYSWADTDSESEADQIRSRFPCDEVLVYSYRVGVWSVWRPPLCLGIQWMTRGLDAEGNNRTVFLGSDKRLYAMDDAFGQFDQESNKTAIAQTGSVTTITGLTTGIKMRASMTAAFYSGGDGTLASLIGKRTIDSTTDSSITLDSAITLPTGGCTMLVGPHECSITTTFVNWKRGEKASVGQMGMRYNLWSNYSDGGDPAFDPQVAFASVSGLTSERTDGVWSPKTSSYTTNGSTTYTTLSETPSYEHVFEREFGLGEVGGKNHQFTFDLIGGAQIRLHDLYTFVK
jgi:hypothetical protein